jgi:L-seryl-tRNA(Ser) seleniumtransferase
VEVETAEELEKAAGPQTAMMLFFNDADPRGQVKAAEFVQLGKKLGIPTFNDAAADVPPLENLSKYVKMGFDLVTFSGGKGIRGPQSAGLLLGRKDLISAARLNTSPISDTFARGMKVNKEEMLGMLVALELYYKKDHAAEWKEWERRCAVISKALTKVKSVEAKVNVPEIANHVPTLAITWDQSVVKITPPEVKKKLLEGDPSIEAAPGTSRQRLGIGVWMMQPGDAEVVAKRLQQILKEAAQA